MPRVLAGVTAVVALLGFLGLFGPTAANWPMFQKNILHSGVTAQDGAESDSTAWYYEIRRPEGFTGDVIWSSPIVNTLATKVYVATRFGRLYCFDLADGDSLWARDLPGGLTATPALANGCLFVVAEGDSSLYCLDAADGDSVWATKLGDTWWDVTGVSEWMESSACVVGDSVVYVGSLDGTVYCLYTADGTVKWQSGLLGDYIVSSPAYHDGRLYVGATGGLWLTPASGVYCLNAADGDTIWYYTYETGNAGGTMSSPMIANGRVYIGTNDNWNGTNPPNGGSINYFLESRDEEPPPPYQVETPDWTYGIDCDVRGTPVCVGGLVYITSGRGLYAFDEYGGQAPVYGVDHGAGVTLGTGSETWSSFGVSDRNTIAEQEILLFVGDGGSDQDPGVYCLDKGLNVMWFDVDRINSKVWGSPAIAAGKVVVAANNGMVACFVDDAESGRIISPWGVVTLTDGEGGESSASEHEPKTHTGLKVLVEPNPCGIQTVFSVTLPEGHLRGGDLALFDCGGRLVRRLGLSESPNGVASCQWDGTTDRGVRADAGVYLYRLRTEGVAVAGRAVVGQ